MEALAMTQPIATYRDRSRYLPEWLSVNEAADKSGYHPEYLRFLIREGRIEATKKGTMWWVDPGSLDAYLKDAQETGDARYTPRRE